MRSIHDQVDTYMYQDLAFSTFADNQVIQKCKRKLFFRLQTVIRQIGQGFPFHVNFDF